MYAVFYKSTIVGDWSTWLKTSLVGVYQEAEQAAQAVENLNTGENDQAAYAQYVAPENQGRVIWYVRYGYKDELQGASPESVSFSPEGFDGQHSEQWGSSEGGALSFRVFAANRQEAIERAEQWRAEIRQTGVPGGKGMTWIIGNGALPHGTR